MNPLMTVVGLLHLTSAEEARTDNVTTGSVTCRDVRRKRLKFGNLGGTTLRGHFFP